jgi:hypothetical protein
MQAILLFALFIQFFFFISSFYFFFLDSTHNGKILILSDLVSGEGSLWSVTGFLENHQGIIEILFF